MRVLERLPRRSSATASSRSSGPTCATPPRSRPPSRPPQAAFAAGAPVVFQATFADEGFIGFADFIVRQPDGRYLVQDSQARPSGARHRAAAARRLRRAARARRRPVRRHGRAAARRRLDERAPPRRHRARLPRCAAHGSSRSSPSGSPTTARSPGATRATRSTGAARRATSRCRRTATCCSSPACASRSARPSSRRASRRSTQLAASDGPGAGHPRRHDREPARAGAAAARGRGRRSSPPMHRGPPLARRPAAAATRRRARRRVARRDPRARRRRPVLRLRGRPALHRGRGDRLGPRLPLRHGRHRRAVHAALGAQLRRGAGRARAVPRARRRPTGGAPEHAHLPLRELRAHPPHSIAARHGVGEAKVFAARASEDLDP